MLIIQDSGTSDGPCDQAHELAPMPRGHGLIDGSSTAVGISISCSWSLPTLRLHLRYGEFALDEGSLARKIESRHLVTSRTNLQLASYQNGTYHGEKLVPIERWRRVQPFGRQGNNAVSS